MQINKTILLVDDEVIIAMAQSKTISGFGYEVRTAYNGEDAVHIAAGKVPVDLVLMDIDLGSGIDGTESARRILEKRNIPIVFLTSHSEREMVERVRGITRYGYVIKNSGDFVLQSSIEMAFELFEAHEKLSESESLTHTLVRTIPDLIWLKDLEGTYLACNQKFEEFFGASEEDIIGKTDYEFLKKEDADFFRNHDRNAIEAGKPRVNEEWITFANDGRRALLETIKTPMTGRDGRMIGVLGIARDITERKRVEDALNESELKYRTLVETSLVGVYIIQDSLFRFVNKQFCEMFGYTYEELVDVMGPDDTTYPGDRELVSDNIKKRISGEIDFIEYEFRGVRKDGTVIFVKIFGSISVLNGKPAILGTIIDITEQKQYQEALEKQVLALSRPLDDPSGILFTDLFNIDDIQRLQDQFADATKVASIITYPDGTPITQPSNFCRLCKEIIRSTEKGRINCFQSDAVIGRHNPEGPIIQPCLSGGLWDAGASITVGGRHIANWLIGQIRNEELNEEKMLEYADTIGADREEFKKALSEVPEMPGEQFEKISRALFSLANELSLKAYQNLQQARIINERMTIEQQLIKSNSEKETLLKEMQHRMKNTLGIVASLLSLEKNKIRDDKLHHILNDAITRVQAIGQLYQHLHDTGSAQVIELKGYITSIARQLLASYTPRQDVLLLSLETDDIVFNMKQSMNIGLIVHELLLNSLKYAYPPDSIGELRIALTKSDNELHLTISDDGKGLPAGFAIGTNAGTGLQIVALLAGEINCGFHIESTHGTTARLTIPI